MKKALLIFTSIFLLSACNWFEKEEEQEVTPSTPSVEDTTPAETEDEEDEKVSEPDAEKAMIEDQITVDTPLKNSEIASPVTIRGEARGPWFFEGSFPVRLVNENNVELARGNATSTESWMTEDFIPFQVQLTFDPGTSQSGTIILEKDNPSGLPQNAGKLEIPVTF